MKFLFGATTSKAVSEIRQFVLIVVAVLAVRVVVAEPYYVPSGSMEPTLAIGDDLITSKFAYGYSRYSMLFGWGPASEHRLFENLPERGDVIVFRLPRDPSQNYVKRVIGLPGDRIQVIGGRLWINEQELPVREDGTGPMEYQDGNAITLPRFIETLPNGKEHPIYRMTSSGSVNNTDVYVVPGPSVHDGRQSRQFARQPRPARAGRRRLCTGRKSGRPRRIHPRLVGFPDHQGTGLDLAVGSAPQPLPEPYFVRRLICAAALLAGVPAAAAEAPDCFYDLAATRNYELGYAAKAMPTPDGKAVIYLRASARDATQHLYEYDLASGREKELVTPEKLLGGADEVLSVEEKARRERARITAKGFTEFQLTEDGSSVLVGLSGKLYLVSRADGSVRNVPGEGWGAPRLSPDGTHLAAVHGGDVSAIDLTAGTVTALTSGAGETVQRGTADFVAAEELDRQDGAWWSPDGRFLAYEETDSASVEPHYIAGAVDPAKEPDEFRYPRAGTDNPKLRLGIVSAAGGATVWAQWDNKEFPYLARVTWPKKGPLSLLVMNRAQTEERLLAVDPKTGATKLVLAEQDKAWLELAPDAGNGRSPSIFPRWLDNGSGFLWATERSGQWQIELHKPDGSLAHKVTPDNWRVGGLADLDEKRGEIVVAGGPDRLSNALYKVKLSGGKPVPLVAERGANGAEFGTGHDVLVNSYSWADGQRGVRVLNRNGAVLATLPSVAEQPPSLPNVTWLTAG